VDRTRVPLLAQTSGISKAPFRDSVIVGVAPLLYSLADAKPVPFSLNGSHYFQLEHEEGRLRKRLADLVHEVRKSPIELLVLPELSLPHSLLPVLQDLLYDTDTSSGALQWLVVGWKRADPNPRAVFSAYNSACVLDGSGNILAGASGPEWIQDKHNPYTMSTGEQEIYSLGAELAPPVNRKEAMSVGDRIVVYEGRFGRCAVVICEDLVQDNVQRDLTEMNCSLIFAVLMDGLLERLRWAGNASLFRRDATGVDVLIANSLLLGNREKGHRVEAAVGLHISDQNPAPYLRIQTSPGSLISSHIKIDLPG